MPFLRTDLPSKTLLRTFSQQKREEAREPKVRYDKSWTIERFVRENLAAVTADRRYLGRGPRRIRKKKAKAFLRRWWTREKFKMIGQVMGSVIWTEFNRRPFPQKVFSVTPLP